MPKTLLVVEPDAVQRQLIDVLLTEDRYDLVFVSSGREALSYLRDATPSLALLSVELPDITGVEICEKMKRVTRLADVPVVLVVAASGARGIDPATRDLARLVGADLLLQKPLGDKNLRSRLAQLLADEANSQRPTRAPGLGTEILEETLADIKGEAKRKELERENDRLRQRLEGLTSELETLREQHQTLRERHQQTSVANTPQGEYAEVPAHSRELEKLERRNELLRQELEKCKSSKKRRGLFGGLRKDS